MIISINSIGDFVEDNINVGLSSEIDKSIIYFNASIKCFTF